MRVDESSKDSWFSRMGQSGNHQIYQSKITPKIENNIAIAITFSQEITTNFS